MSNAHIHNPLPTAFAAGAGARAGGGLLRVAADLASPRHARTRLDRGISR